MLDNIRYHMLLKSIDKNIQENLFDVALGKLNELVKKDFKPALTYLKRGRLCKKLLMYSDAYSDFTYVIEHCAKKEEAYYERVFLNFEIANFYEAILDAETILSFDKSNFDVKRIKFLSLAYSNRESESCEYILGIFNNNKYKTIQFIFNEVAIVLAKDEFSRGLKLLEIIELLDPNNPIKLLKEATIYGYVGDTNSQNSILKKLDNIFPKYFVSHFKFTDMYQEKDLLEISFLLELSIFDKKNIFVYPLKILEGYKKHMEGHITESKMCFEDAIKINSSRPEAYVLLAQTLQLMSGYDKAEYRNEAEKNYKLAEEIYLRENLPQKAETMRRQLQHLNSPIKL
ncbi:MAG: hypothetical protein MJ237_03550 [bacterium]|nr:hypothetical protein [bacterium]